MRQKLLVAISGVIAGSLFWAGTGSAATVDLEYSLNDGVSYVALASGADITSGGFSQIEASATGVPPLGPRLARHFHDRRNLKWGTRKQHINRVDHRNGLNGRRRVNGFRERPFAQQPNKCGGYGPRINIS